MQFFPPSITQCRHFATTKTAKIASTDLVYVAEKNGATTSPKRNYTRARKTCPAVKNTTQVEEEDRSHCLRRGQPQTRTTLWAPPNTVLLPTTTTPSPSYSPGSYAQHQPPSLCCWTTCAYILLWQSLSPPPAASKTLSVALVLWKWREVELVVAAVVVVVPLGCTSSSSCCCVGREISLEVELELGTFLCQSSLQQKKRSSK